MVLPKGMRIKGHRCFDYLHKVGSRYHGSYMVLKVAKANPQIERSHGQESTTGSCQCAIAISSKVSKKAVQRNVLRCMFHAHLKRRLYLAKEQTRTWVLLSLKPNSSEKDQALLRKDCDKLLRKAGLLQ
mgnify:CR=1 FL=1